MEGGKGPCVNTPEIPHLSSRWALPRPQLPQAPLVCAASALASGLWTAVVYSRTGPASGRGPPARRSRGVPARLAGASCLFSCRDLPRAGAPTPIGRQGALQAESSGLLRRGDRDRRAEARPEVERGARLGNSHPRRPSHVFPEIRSSPRPGCAPRSVSCPTDLGLPGSSLPAGTQNRVLASSFPFGYHPPSLKRITTTRMTPSPPWPEDQTSCRRQPARPSSPVLCPLSALPEWGRERRGWVASRTTALHGRSLCVGPPWSGSTWERPARPGGGAAWPSILLVTPWA